MTDDKLAFLDAPAAEPKMEPAAPHLETPAIQPVAAEPAAVPPPQQEPHTVPLPKYLDAYNEARETKRQMAELQRKLQSLENPVQEPDLMTDPDGFKEHLRKQISGQFEQQLALTRENMSEIMARQSYGDERVDAAYKAAEERLNSFDFQRIMSSQHPWHELVRWHQREDLLSKIGDDPDEWVKRRYAEMQVQSPAPGAAPVVKPRTASPAIPPPPLTRAPSAGNAKDVPSGPGNAFSSVFG